MAAAIAMPASMFMAMDAPFMAAEPAFAATVFAFIAAVSVSSLMTAPLADFINWMVASFAPWLACANAVCAEIPLLILAL